MHPNEVHTDASLVERLVMSQFPQWSGLPVARVSSAGTDNALYRLGDDLVVRMPRIDWATAELPSRSEWLGVLAPHLPVTVPVPLAVGDPQFGYPWRWSIYPWLAGTNPEVGQLDNPEQLGADLASFIAALQAIDPSGGPAANYRGGLLRDRDEPTRKALVELGERVDQSAVLGAWDEALALPGSQEEPVWLHGDLSPGNLLLVDGRLSAVIDFTPGVGLPDCELIVAWNLLPEAGRAVLRSELGIADDAWARGKGWALTIALLQLPYYWDTNPALADNARHVIDQVLGD